MLSISVAKENCSECREAEEVHGICSSAEFLHWLAFGIGTELVWTGTGRVEEVVCIRYVNIDSVCQNLGADGVECNEKCIVK